MKGGPFAYIKKIAKKVSQSRKNLHKKVFGYGRDSNPRPSACPSPQKILINLYAQLTLVWQLKEASL